MSNVSIIFTPEPDQWGLRGDPFLWQLLKEQYQTVELPYPPKVLREEILRIFADLTGELPEPGKHYYVNQFAKTHVGMSTGWISGDFWQATAIPLLMERLEQTNCSNLPTKDLSGLPNAERLKNFCKGLAALDIIMVEEEWSFIRHYTYNPAWRKGKEAFFATDGSDQSMIVMFAPEGCVINGVDSELYDWEEKLPRIEDLTDGMPSALQKLMGSREVKKMKSTFCVWTEDGTTWHCNPMDGEDASKDLLSTIDGNPQSYVDYGKWFYPADLPLEAVRQLADGVPVTKELVAALNPKRNEWEEIKAGLDKIGYPNEL